MHTAENAEDFLACAGDFQLGELDTEQPHPRTVRLSEQCRDDLPAAVDALRAVDLDALDAMAEKLAPAAALARDIHAAWQGGGRVFLAGCGATGRLSLALEVFARAGWLPETLRDKVIGFMAGGDTALVRSIEGFEDFPAYGARQLRELGFTDGDLLIASTEGGETPWVIGAAEEAARLGQRAPWFCYCNPDDKLRALVERSRRVLDNPAIRKWNLAVGPMGIAGSTRMQSSTVLQYGIGLALEHAAREDFAPQSFSHRLTLLRQAMASGWDFLPAFIAREAGHYQAGRYLLYTTRDCGIAVLTDTTERAPTFSLPVFENTADPRPVPSLCYLSVPGTPDADSAWRTLLGRNPRCLDWPAELPVTRRAALLGYDISERVPANRARVLPGAGHARFHIGRSDGGAVAWELDELTAQAVPAGLPELEAQMRLKMLLNAHSTLVMGRLGRYAGNLMTYVKPSNNKLIDRAIRYIRILAARETGTAPDYATVCRTLFRVRAQLAPDEPIVLKTREALRTK